MTYHPVSAVAPDAAMFKRPELAPVLYVAVTSIDSLMLSVSLDRSRAVHVTEVPQQLLVNVPLAVPTFLTEKLSVSPEVFAGAF